MQLAGRAGPQNCKSSALTTRPRCLLQSSSLFQAFCSAFHFAPLPAKAPLYKRKERLKAEIPDSNPKGDHVFLIRRVALVTLIVVVVVVVVVVVSLITEGIIPNKQVNDFILFCCYQVFQIQVGKPFMTQLHLM